jgi:hypothetical protein
MHAAVVAAGMLPYEAADGPVIVEISSEFDTFTYRIGTDISGALVVETHSERKDRVLVELAEERGIRNVVPSSLIEYRPFTPAMA